MEFNYFNYDYDYNYDYIILYYVFCFDNSDFEIKIHNNII